MVERVRLSVQDVGHMFADKQALTGIDFELGAERCALVGVNGAGKSTLLTVLSGGLKPSTGDVRVNGLDLYASRDRRRCLRKIAYMPQALAVPGNLTPLEVVKYLAWMRGLSRAHASRSAVDSLARVGLADQSRSKMKTLSGGMRRRVALAQAIAAGPDILLLDEPSTGLDPLQRRNMIDIIASLDANILFSSHVMEDVEDVAARIVILHEGGVCFDGPIDHLKRRSPAGTAPAKMAEAGFLQVLSSQAPLS